MSSHRTERPLRALCFMWPSSMWSFNPLCLETVDQEPVTRVRTNRSNPPPISGINIGKWRMAFDIWPLSGLGVEISMERCEIHLHLLMRWSCESHCSRLRKRMQIWGKAIRDLSMLSRHELEVTRSNHHTWCYALWQDGQPINGFPKSDWQWYADTLKIILLQSRIFLSGGFGG